MSMEVTLLCAIRLRGCRDDVRRLAAQHWQRLSALPRDHDERNVEAIDLLDHAKHGLGYAEGRNGEMFSWGAVTNYGSCQSFIAALRPFFSEAWDDGIVSAHSKIVVFEQIQDQASITAVEISLPFHMRCNKRYMVHPADLVVHTRHLGFPIFYDFEEIDPLSRATFDTKPEKDESS